MKPTGISATGVVTLGEALIRLYPPHGWTLEQAAAWHVSVAGAEVNVAIALARVGQRACWVSRLPRNPLGRRVAGELAAAGVDVSRVVWADEGRVGLYFTQTGITPEDMQVWYDRGHSCFANLEPESIRWEGLETFELMHFTGITPALGDGPRRTVGEAVAQARARGLRVSLDGNYRARLWTPERARKVLTELFGGRVDLLICSRKDASVIFGLDGDEQALRGLQEAMGAQVVVLTRGVEGAMAWDGKQMLFAGAYRGEIVDRIGRGDAFAAGLLDGYLAGDLERGLRQGCALAAMAQARWGDPLLTSREDLTALLASGPTDRR
ncbi:MAG: sugar kinase [Firmicutes bacterium]|nr:sugar kinase [Bacillota bacterium]